MHVITSRNVNTMLPEVMKALREHAKPTTSRNGPVLRFEDPVALCYTHPLERVCFDAQRDANPFFHLMESLWMLAGRRDVDFVAYYNKQMVQFSDNGRWFNATYGHRMRCHFAVDQLIGVIEELRKTPDTRQAVINLWDPIDLCRTTKDKACNLSILFGIGHVSGQLNMTVFNRSNDAIYGAVAGANPVHMSYFHEFVANAIGKEVGKYYQISNNLHLYTNDEKSKLLLEDPRVDNRYDQEIDVPQLVDLPYREMLREIEAFCELAGKTVPVGQIFKSGYINNVAVPIHNAFSRRKTGEEAQMLDELDRCADRAWAVACGEWIERREKK